MKRKRRSFWLSVSWLALALLFMTVWHGLAPASESFYKGKTITALVGYSPGSVIDLFARVVARHISRYIPGEPSVIVQNMPGAASLVAANFLYNRSKPDGLTYVVLGTNIPIRPLVDPQGIAYDPTKFTPIGSVSKARQILIIRKDRPWKTIDDLKKTKKPAHFGASGVGSGPYVIPRLTAEVLGLNIKMVAGYSGGAAVDMALESGEVDGRSTTVELLLSRSRRFLDDDLIIPLVMVAQERHSTFPDVPTLYELAPEKKELLDLVLGPSLFFFGFHTLPPAVPDDRVKTLRTAFRSLFQDQKFTKEVTKFAIVAPTFGEELEAIIKKIAAIPPDQQKRLRRIWGKK